MKAAAAKAPTLAREELRWRAYLATRPCGHCDLDVPHAFVEPGPHTWNPHHMSVDPDLVLAALGPPILAEAEE